MSYKRIAALMLAAGIAFATTGAADAANGVNVGC
jgi:hypothetical protein